jgi:hypothetical protein
MKMSGEPISPETLQNLESPLKCLLSHFNQAHFRLAPERAGELCELLKRHNVNFHFDSETLDMVFEGASLFGGLGMVRLGLRGLERMWVHSLAAIHIYLRFRADDFAKPQLLPATEEGRRVAALLGWAIRAEVEGNPQPWPSDLPQPRENPVDELNALTNEVFLGIAGFAVLHELGHIIKEHRSVYGTRDERFRQEFEADEWAYDWVMDKWRDLDQSTGVYTKRCVLIASLFAVLASLDVYTSRRVQTLSHPNIIDRLLRFLVKHANEDNGLPSAMAWNVAATTIHMHLSQLLMWNPPPFERARDYFDSIRPLFVKKELG